MSLKNNMIQKIRSRPVMFGQKFPDDNIATLEQKNDYWIMDCFNKVCPNLDWCISCQKIFEGVGMRCPVCNDTHDEEYEIDDNDYEENENDEEESDERQEASEMYRGFRRDPFRERRDRMKNKKIDENMKLGDS